MSYTVEVVEIQPQRVLAVRATTIPSQIGETVGPILGEVWGYMTGKGARPAGPPFIRYHQFCEDAVDMEVGVPVAVPLDGEGRIAVTELPGGQVAVTVHWGAYDHISAAHEAVQSWIAENGKEAAGAPWEVYWTDPQQEPDVSRWKTEVIWPVR